MDKTDGLSDDYTQGQMMGMLCMVRLLRSGKPIHVETLDKIERIASDSLGAFLNIPEEDVILMVDNQLETL